MNTTDKLVQALHEKIALWKRDVLDYPDDSEGIAARAGVECCAREILEMLAFYDTGHDPPRNVDGHPIPDAKRAKPPAMTVTDEMVKRAAYAYDHAGNKPTVGTFQDAIRAAVEAAIAIARVGMTDEDRE